MAAIAPNHSQQLRQLMQQVGFSSFKALSQTAGVSEKQIRNLRQGRVAQMRVEPLLKLAQALQVSVTELLDTFSEFETHPQKQHEQSSPTSHLSPLTSHLNHELTTLKQEYDRLQAKLTQREQELRQEFQQSSLQVLESLIVQLPTAAYAAQQNPQAPAVKLLPLLRPIDALLQSWGITAIAPVGSEIPYDPQQHQLMEGTAQPGDLVKVRYTGYRQGDKLLYRAKVSLIK